jgi:hypothetical protein
LSSNEGEKKVESSVRIEYLSENKFNVYKGEEECGEELVPIWMDAEIKENREEEGEIMIMTKDE